MQVYKRIKTLITYCDFCHERCHGHATIKHNNKEYHACFGCETKALEILKVKENKLLEKTK